MKIDKLKSCTPDIRKIDDTHKYSMMDLRPFDLNFFYFFGGQFGKCFDIQIFL